MNTRPILVTGSHRSGTTWIGKMLAANPDIAYLHEPFNVPYAIIRHQFSNWFQYICTENEDEHRHKIDRLLAYDYPLLSQLRLAKTPKRALGVIRDQLIFIRFRLGRKRPLVKDPLALFSTEWLQKTYNMQVVVTIRHPAAFCSSLKLKDWQFKFKNLADQPLLMEHLLQPYAEQIDEYAARPPEILEQAVLIWNIIHFLIADWQKKHRDWIFVRHEDLSMEPIEEFKKLYQRLDIPFTPEAEAIIRESSGSHNPKEQTKGNEFVRDSKANIKNWKKRLTAREIQLVRELTFPISDAFYTEADW